MKRSDYTIYHIAHNEFVNTHQDKCGALPNETVHLFDGSNYESFSKVVNTCVANCATEIVIMMSYRITPTSDNIRKLLFYIDKGYAFVSLICLGFFAIKKELFRRIGFMDENYIPGGFEDLDFVGRIKEANLGIFATREADFSLVFPSAWRSEFRHGKAKLAMRHYKAKWNTPDKITAIRLMLEQSYSYYLGPSTNEKFLDWSHTRIGELKITDMRLRRPPYNMGRWPTYDPYLRLQNLKVTFCPSIILNTLNSIDDLSYLEIAVNPKITFDKVAIKNKNLIPFKNTNHSSLRTEKYLQENSNKNFDITFINNTSDFHQAIKIINSLANRCEKFILIHNCVPPDKNFTSKGRCGDLYKLLYYVLKETNIKSITSSSNYGLTFIKMPINELIVPEKYHQTTFEEFSEFIKTQRTYTANEIAEIIKGWLE